jgi:hypothetical protein
MRMSSTRRYAALLAIGALLAVPVAGCGGDDDDEGESGEATPAATSTAPSGGGGGETVDMSLTDFALNPADPALKAGSVTFNVTNDGQTTHALEVEGPGEEMETEDLAPGGSAKLTRPEQARDLRDVLPGGRAQGDGYGGRDHGEVNATTPPRTPT